MSDIQLDLYTDVQEGETVTEEEQGQIQYALEEALRLEKGEGQYEISLSFVDGATIREWNRNYRGVDTVTDVLSFPLDDEMQLDFQPLGDIVICMDRVREQAKEFGHSCLREMIYLSVHSLLHLLGYDHEDPKEKRQMRAEEKRIMKHLGLFRTDDENG